MLPELYRAAYWFEKVASLEPLGTLPKDAPYNDLGHLLRHLVQDAAQLLSASPPPLSRELPEPYWDLRPAGDYGVAEPPADTEEDILDDVWSAAYRAGPVETWSPPTFQLQSGEQSDIIWSEECEVFLYSEHLRAVIESQRRAQDDHAWLPLPVLTTAGGEAGPYWLLNPGGPVTKDLWGIIPERLAGRAIVRLRGGDDVLGFADRLRSPVEAACPSVLFKPV